LATILAGTLLVVIVAIVIAVVVSEGGGGDCHNDLSPVEDSSKPADPCTADTCSFNDTGAICRKDYVRWVHVIPIMEIVMTIPWTGRRSI